MAPTRHDMSMSEPMARPVSSRGEDFDALADLFLDDRPAHRAVVAEEPPRVTQTPTRSAAITDCELIVAGHLPVLSGAWVVQYASKASRDRGVPVALAQLGHERTAIQILWPTAPESRPVPARDLRAAVAEARRAGAVWMMATDEVAALEILRDPRLTGACLLTAANEAATVAAYQSLRALWRELSQRDAGSDFPVRLAIAGASPADARRVCERIGRAAGVFADRRVELAAAIERVGTTIATPIFESGHRTEASDLLELIETTPEATVRPAPVAPLLRERGPVATPSVPETPVPTAAEAAPRDRRSPERRLISMIEEPTISPTPLVCPDAPRVEIGVDAGGALHLLANAGDELLDAAIRDLFIARAWLERQSALIRLALARPGEGVLQIESHLLVPSARSARPFLDSATRVHLFKQVAAPGQQVWICEPLN